jgi:protein-disulfide isomerase
MGLALLAALALVLEAPAQTEVPAAPAAEQTAPAAPAAAPMFPKVNPDNFTASSPSKETLEAFLQSSWGKVEGRVWQIQAILKTPVEGVSRVVVLIGDKTGKQQTQALVFFAFADGKHFVAGDRLVAAGPEVAAAEAAAAKAASAKPATPVAVPKLAADSIFPAPDPVNFTSSAVKQETIDAFLHATWGFNESFIWQIEAMQKTSVDGLSRVVVMFADKTNKDKPQPLVFFVLPDGKHILAGEQMIAFGANPFADARLKLQQQANGPYRGAASKDLELVEFADFQCPHCRLAQANMEKLAVDYPKAHIVFQNDPIPSIHPAAVRAASYGVCVAKLAGSTAFFNFAASVFEGQDALMTPDGATLTLNSALVKAGVEQEKVTACIDTPETKAAIDASMKLAGDLEISQVPTLAINGRLIAATMPYETIKKIIDFQIKLDGVN